MGLDLSKLTSAPWEARCLKPHAISIGDDEDFVVPPHVAHVSNVEGFRITEYVAGRMRIPDDAEFIALARNDLDVKQRRGWHTEKCTEADQWVVPQLIERLFSKNKKEGDALIEVMYQQGHDVGLLTKADAWYKANVEKAP